jgi:hypothetical protein
MHVEQSRVRPIGFEQSPAFYEGVGLTRYRDVNGVRDPVSFT